jgi:hypothetical protein
MYFYYEVSCFHKSPFSLDDMKQNIFILALMLSDAHVETVAVHVEASMDCRDPSFLEALDRETQILRKRVEACKSHILMVTCFDALLKPQD